MSDNKDLLGNNPLTPSNNKFEFKGLDDLIVNPTQPNYEDLVSDDYSKMLQRHADDINRFAPKINHNLNNPYPQSSTSNFSPFDQKNGLDPNSIEARNLALTKGLGETTKLSEEPKIANPIYAGIRSHNFDRF